MTPTSKQELQREIAGTEKAIRLLIGERQALDSKLARAEALLKLEQSRLAAILGRSKPLPSGSRFPDVSSFQPNVNWAAVHGASSIGVGGFAITKISEGLGWSDPFGSRRWREMAAQSMRRGGYHFGHPSVSPIDQATHFLTVLHGNGVVIRDTDVLVYDCEVTDGQAPHVVAQCAAEFAATVRKEVPAKLWLYGGGPFCHDNGVTLDGYDAHWLAAYVGNPAPYMVFGKARTVAWQYTDGKFGPNPHVCPGIGSGDLSIVL